MPPKEAVFFGGKKPRASSATAGYIKTGRKDGKGRVIYTSEKGEDKVRCKSKSTGKIVWRKVTTAMTGGEVFGLKYGERTLEGDLGKIEDRLKAAYEKNDNLNERWNKLDLKNRLENRSASLINYFKKGMEIANNPPIRAKYKWEELDFSGKQCE